MEQVQEEAIQKDRVWCIYMHTNTINDKKYIGITYCVQNRWGKDGSRYLIKKKDGSYVHRYFGAAIQKYGWENFKHEILFDGLTQEEAQLKEIELISFYNTNDPSYGYNLTKGGDGIFGYQYTDEDKRKISIAQKENYSHPENNPFYGKHHTEETKRKISEAKKGKNTGPDNHNYGKPMSQEVRDKMSVTQKARMSNPDNRPMLGKHHTEEAKEKMRLAKQNISDETRKKISEKAKLRVGQSAGRARKIIRLIDEKIYGCIMDAADDNNIDRHTVTRRCKKHQDFMYYDEWLIEQND